MAVLVKQHKLKCKITSRNGIELIKIEKDLSIEDYIKIYTKPVTEKGKKNSYQKILPFIDGAENLKKENVDYLFPFQTIIIEYDTGSRKEQEERIRATAEVINTSSFYVYSGNKSNHHFIFFKNFAANAAEYRKKCFELLTFLAHKLPKYYAYPNGSTKTDEMLIPDTSVFISTASARQYGGTHTNGKAQKGTIINPGIALKIDDFLMEIPKKPKKKKNGSIKTNSSNIAGLPHEKEEEDLSPEEIKFVNFIHSLILQQNYTCSDESMARIIVYWYKDRIRTIKDNKDIPLAIFDNGWKPADESLFTSLCRNLTKKIAELRRVILIKYTSETEEKNAGKFVYRTINYLKTRKSIKIVCEYISSFDEVSTKMSDWDNNKNILMLGNEYVEFTPEDAIYSEKTPDNLCLLSTHTNSIADINNPKCPKFDKALGVIFKHNRKIISYFWRLFSYLLLGDNSEQIVIFFVGLGGNGKSLLAKIISKILGDYSTKLPFNSLEKKRNDNSNNFDVMLLSNRRVAIASELAPGTILRSQFLKEISSSEEIAARHPHDKYGHFECVAKIIICTNQIPIFDDTSLGMFRRLHILPFTETFDNTNRNINLINELMEEKENILAKGVFNYPEYLEKGINPTDEMKDMLKVVRSESDPVGTFINNCIKFDLNGEIYTNDLYNQYLEWTKARCLTPASKNSFGRKMSYMHPGSRMKSSNNMYRGIAFRDVEDSFEEVEEIEKSELEDVFEIA